MKENTLSVEHLSKEMGMSRVQLYRKITALTNKNVNDYIAEFKVKKAKQLLQDPTKNISDALPKETNKPRPAVVVEDDGLFAPNYPNAILVPLTEDTSFTIAELSVPIEPTAENGCSKDCWAVSHMVTATSKARIRPAESRVTPDQLDRIRRQIATTLGLVA